MLLDRTEKRDFAFGFPVVEIVEERCFQVILLELAETGDEREVVDLFVGPAHGGGQHVAELGVCVDGAAHPVVVGMHDLGFAGSEGGGKVVDVEEVRRVFVADFRLGLHGEAENRHLPASGFEAQAARGLGDRIKKCV